MLQSFDLFDPNEFKKNKEEESKPAAPIVREDESSQDVMARMKS